VPEPQRVPERPASAGPTLLEDFILREKITHFDHERIPERVVHARGSGAHGYFEVYESLARTSPSAPPSSRTREEDAGVRALLDRGRLARLEDTPATCAASR
jgi:catalase